MNRKLLQQLILYIVYYVGDLGGYTTTIRLVKFLYLIDLEYYRRYGEVFTGLGWVYHLFGPYAFALPEIGSGIGFDLHQEEFETKNGKRGRIFRVHEPVEFPSGLPKAMESTIQGILGIWGLEDTSDLIEYTYNTEPMLVAKRGMALDFSVVPRGSKYYELYISTDKKISQKIREGLHNLETEEKDEYVTPETVYDEIFQQGLRALQESDIPDLSGIYPEVGKINIMGTLPEGE